MAQVSKEHYSFFNYMDSGRWASYYHQINEVMRTDAENVLYIGVGDSVVCDFLTRGGGDIVTFDFDESLSPDIVGSLEDIGKHVHSKYGCIVCCEVLEHIPFSCFEDIIRQLAGICTGTLILSVPDRSIRFRILLKVPKLRIQKDITVTRFTEKEIAFNGEHYWEAGNRNYSKKKIRGIVRKYFRVEREYNVFEKNHWFLILKKRQEEMTWKGTS